MEEVKETTNAVESSPAFNEVRLSETEQDAILIQLTEYLLDENLVTLA